ncbi:unnamed protein product, partial [Phaeothamnion confervicola]
SVCDLSTWLQECDDPVLAADPPYVPWLARLVATRNVYVMPMTNALGYFEDRRCEAGRDPNRDFPYQQKPSKCMTTITARAVNEVWREHIFQLAVTFHGGMVAIAYEWGANNHPHRKNNNGDWLDISPDNSAQVAVGSGLSAYAGAFSVSGTEFAPYPADRMNDIVYPVDGGMEDWAYAASWDGPQNGCKPETFGGYASFKTQYDPAMLRTLNILVETSDNKSPALDTLGSTVDIFNPASPGNGHVQRNMRLSLMVIDIVQPYVEWTDASLDTTDAILHWRVSGCMWVDSTFLRWGPVAFDGTGLLARTAAAAEAAAEAGGGAAGPKAGATAAQSGTCRWGENMARQKTMGNKFLATLPVETMADGAYYVAAAAVVDKTWAMSVQPVWPDGKPQSHFVNARTNPEWDMSNGNHRVVGQRLW